MTEQFEIVHSRIAEDGVTFSDLGLISEFIQAEFQIAKDSTITNCDFEIQIGDAMWEDYDIRVGDWIYIPESEWGGRVEIIDHSDDGVIKISGPNLAMALLNPEVICPPYDANLGCRGDYLYINNTDANVALKIMHSASIIKQSGNLFTISSAKTKNITCQCRYEYLLKKIHSVLDDYGLRLKVSHSYDSPTPFIVQAVAKDTVDEFYNQDLGITINSNIDNTSKYGLIIGLGQGDLHERQVVIMSVTEVNGKPVFKEIGLNDSMATNDNIKQYIYDYSSAESLDDLKDGMIQTYKDSLCGSIGVSISVRDDVSLNLGDQISAEDDVTGLRLKTEIAKKILTINSSKITYAYATEGAQ